MDKAVLISIHPRWCELIANGRKTVEVRRTRPKLETPFKVYIYCTVGGITAKERDRNLYTDLRGKVIGEFVCDRIFPIRVFPNGTIQDYMCNDLEKSCVPYDDIANYVGTGCAGYGWHISDLMIYNTPSKLINFRRVCQNDLYCESCAMFCAAENKCGNAALYMTSPPVNWCYVEDQISELAKAVTRAVAIAAQIPLEMLLGKKNEK